MMELDIDQLKTWFGRTESSEDIVTSPLAAEFVATFSPHLAPVGPGEALLGIHWCLAPAIKPLA